MKKSKLQFKIKNHPNFNEEGKAWKRGYGVVVGLDEAGRGPLAGPVVAAAVTVKKLKFEILYPKQIRNLKFQIQNIKDSKKLSARRREEWYKILTTQHDIRWGIGMVSEKVIDKINIFEATKLAMKKAILSLDVEPEYLLLDGNFTLEDLPIAQKAIIRGDEKVFSCAAASIIAKVTRDRLMVKYSRKYPQYGFDRHKGYGTRLHFWTLKKYGACAIHRKSFHPIKINEHK